MKSWRLVIGEYIDHAYVTWFIQVLIVVSLVVLSIQTMDISPELQNILENINGACLIAFVLEYSLRVYTTKNPFKFMFSFYGIVDLLAIVPYFVGLGADSSSLRALRLLRIFQLLKLVRYSKALNRFKVAFAIAKEELAFFMFATCIIFYLAAVGIYHFEHIAQPEALRLKEKAREYNSLAYKFESMDTGRNMKPVMHHPV